MARVDISKVSKRFGSNVVIPELDLAIRAGEFMVLVGPSGCGKSTLLRMIAGLEEVSSGEVGIGGKVVNDVDPRDRGVAMVFQSYALYPHMTVEQNLSFALKLAGTDRAEMDRRIHEAAEVLGLGTLMDRKPAQLSGGQKQRVAMGRAMVRQPAVFLFDEPLSNLDAQLRVRMRAEISRLHRRLGCTVVYVTHDQVEAMTLADRIAVMYGGKLEQVGAPQDVYHDPQTQFVASFIGTPSMNFLPASKLPEGVKLPQGAHSVGFRPEATQIGPGKKEVILLGVAKVSLIERLGTSAHIHLDMDGTNLVSEARSQSLPTLDSQVKLFVEGSDFYFFDSIGKRVKGKAGR